MKIAFRHDLKRIRGEEIFVKSIQEWIYIYYCPINIFNRLVISIVIMDKPLIEVVV